MAPSPVGYIEANAEAALIGLPKACRWANEKLFRETLFQKCANTRKPSLVLLSSHSMPRLVVEEPPQHGTATGAYVDNAALAARRAARKRRESMHCSKRRRPCAPRSLERGGEMTSSCLISVRVPKKVLGRPDVTNLSLSVPKRPYAALVRP